MFDTIFGLPTHGLVVHAVVVLLPLAAIGAVGIALVPALRRRFGLLVALATIVAVSSVPLATRSGARLYARKSFGFGADDLREAGLMERHRQLGDQVLPWALVLLAATLLVVLLPLVTRRREAATPAGVPGGRSGGPSGPLAGPPTGRSAGGHPTAQATASRVATSPAGSTDQVERRPAGWTRWVTLLAIAGVLTGAVGSTVTVVRAGHAGSKAVWDGLVTETANIPRR